MRIQSDFTYEDLPSVSRDRQTELELLERQLEVRFKDYQLFNLAFCHRSYTNEVTQKISNNEKLELLGDSVLGLSVIDYLYRTYPDKSEGDLAKIKSHVVSEAVLSEIGFELGIDNYILIGRGEEVGGGRNRKAVLEDCMEALFGAYFLDCGDFEDAQKLVLRFLIPKIQDVVANRHQKDYKTLIQEYSQKELRQRPQYAIISQSGPDHAKTYRVKIEIGAKNYGEGEGPNRKEAEQQAAALAYATLVEAPSKKSSKRESASRASAPQISPKKRTPRSLAPARRSTSGKSRSSTSSRATGAQKSNHNSIHASKATAPSQSPSTKNGKPIQKKRRCAVAQKNGTPSESREFMQKRQPTQKGSTNRSSARKNVPSNRTRKTPQKKDS